MSDDYGIGFAQPNGDFLPGLPEVAGRELIIHDLIWWLSCDENFLAGLLPEGQPWDPEARGRGYNLLGMLNAKIRNFSAIQRRVAAECNKDERVKSATVLIEESGENVLFINVSIVDVGDSEFEFTIKISDLTIERFYEGREV